MPITLEEDFFEHLLDCMCNQKYLPTLGASDLASEREKQDQAVIDAAYHKAMELLIDNSTTNEKLENIAQFIISESKHWNDGEGAFDLANALKEFIRLYLIQDSKSDKAIRLKEISK